MLTRSMIQAAMFGVAVGDGLQNLKFDMPFTGMEAIFRWLGDWNTTWPDASSSADGPGVHSLSQPWPFVDTSKLPYGGTTSVSSAFMGTGVTIVGEVKGSLSSSSNEMSLTLNNDYRSVPLPVNSSIIASGNLAAPAPATMSFSVDQGQLLITIKAIILTMVMSSEATSITQVQTRTEYFVVQDKLNDFFRYTDNWSVNNDTMHAKRNGNDLAYAKAMITVPDNTSMIMVNGTMGPSYIGVDVAPVPAIRSDSKADRPNVNVTRPSLSSGAIYLAVLDPTSRYNITISPAWTEENTDIDLYSATFWSSLVDKEEAPPAPSAPANPVSSKSTGGLSKGAIAGIAVGAVAGALIAALIAFLLARRSMRKRLQRLTREDPNTFVVDEDGEVVATPFKQWPEPLSLKGTSSADTSNPTSQPASAPPVTPRVQQEYDAGVASPIEYVPPRYDEAWASPTSPLAPMPLSPLEQQTKAGKYSPDGDSRDTPLSPYAALAPGALPSGALPPSAAPPPTGEKR